MILNQELWSESSDTFLPSHLWYIYLVGQTMTREWDTDSSNSTTSSESLFDEDDVNVRVYPDWAKYRHTIERGAYRLDTCRDVREHYEKYCPAKRDASGYLRACGDSDDDALCRDAGLVSSMAAQPQYCLFSYHLLSPRIYIEALESQTAQKLL